MFHDDEDDKMNSVEYQLVIDAYQLDAPISSCEYFESGISENIVLDSIISSDVKLLNNNENIYQLEDENFDFSPIFDRFCQKNHFLSTNCTYDDEDDTSDVDVGDSFDELVYNKALRNFIDDINSQTGKSNKSQSSEKILMLWKQQYSLSKDDLIGTIVKNVIHE
jgi:hypothetical protein